jgi:outer membrane protein
MVLCCLSATLRAENLLDVLRLGQENDARWASAQAAHDAGVEKEKQGGAALLPSVSLSGEYTSSKSDITYHGNSPFSAGNRIYDSADYGINVTHPLYRRQNYATYQQSLTQVTLSDEQLNLAHTDLLLRIATAYFEQLGAQDNVNLSAAEIAALAEQLDQAQAQLRAGVSAVTDLFDSKARHALAVAKEVAARNELLAKQQALRRITGAATPVLAGIRPDAVLPALNPATADEWVALAFEKNPQIRSQKGAQRVAEWGVERARGAHYPTLDLVAAYTRNRSSGSLYISDASRADTLSASVRLQVPLFDGGDASSRVREAVANLDKARDDLEDARRDIENQCRLTFLELANGMAQIHALEEAHEANEKLVESSKLGRKAGLRTTTDVLNAEEQLFGIKRDLSKARYDYLLNVLKLKGLAGALQERDFGEINKLLVEQ